MVDKLASYTVLCQGGLDTSENHLLLDSQSPGSASSLINYEVGLHGGYKRIDGYEVFDADYPEVDSAAAEGGILGVIIFQDIVIAARKQQGSSTYKYYYQDAAGWTAYAPGFNLTSTGVIKIRHLIITFGSTEYLLLVDGVNFLTIFNGTTWYQCKAANAGGSGAPGGNQIIDAPAYIEMFRNTIFISGDSSYPGIVSYSAPEDVFTWTAAAGGGQLLSGMAPVQLKTFRDAMYVFGQQRIRKVVLDATDFVFQDIADNIGCIASDSVIELNGDVLFLAQDGVRTISGTTKIGDVNLASVSKQIQKLVNEIQEDYDLRYLDAVVIKKKSQFRYFVSQATTTSLGVGIIGGLRGTVDSTNMEYSELQGLRVACVVSGYLSNQEVILHGDYDGKVYKQESGNTFNGSSVYSMYSTPYLTFGDFLTRKQLRKLHVFTQYQGTFTLSAQLNFDWNNPDSLAPSPFSGAIVLAEGTPLYDNSLLYDNAVYYATVNTYPVITYDIQGSGKSTKIAFTTSGNNYPHTIQGFILEFTPQGKR